VNPVRGVGGLPPASTAVHETAPPVPITTDTGMQALVAELEELDELLLEDVDALLLEDVEALLLEEVDVLLLGALLEVLGAVVAIDDEPVVSLLDVDDGVADELSEGLVDELALTDVDAVSEAEVELDSLRDELECVDSLEEDEWWDSDDRVDEPVEDVWLE